MGRALGFALALLACGAPPVRPAEVEVPALALLSPPGSRMTVRAGPAEPIAHTLRYRAGALELAFADATVAEGAERVVAAAYIEQLRERFGAEIEHRPFALEVDGGIAEGVDVIVHATPRVRAVMVWRAGAIARLAVTHAPGDAVAAARVIDSLSFDPSAPIDPRAALGLDATPVPDLPLLRVSTEQLVFREGGREAPFAGQGAALDVAFLGFEGAPPDERERGRLLGGRFRGLPLEAPTLAPIEGDGLAGFAMQAHAHVEGRELTLIGAYLEVDGGVLLVRASFRSAEEEVWSPRLWALIRSLRVR